VADGALVRTWDLTSARGESRLEAALFVVAVRYLFAFAWGPPDGTDPVPGDAWAVTSPVWAGDP
jgi:hypothetical protein